MQQSKPVYWSDGVFKSSKKAFVEIGNRNRALFRAPLGVSDQDERVHFGSSGHDFGSSSSRPLSDSKSYAILEVPEKGPNNKILFYDL